MNNHVNIKNNLELIKQLLEKLSGVLQKERPNCRQILDNRYKFGLLSITNPLEWNYSSQQCHSLDIYINHFQFISNSKKRISEDNTYETKKVKLQQNDSLC